MSTISNKIDLVVSFDTTGSMYPVLAQVRTEVEKFVKQMFSEFTDLRLGIIAHGDYCDAGNPYTIINMELTRDEERLCKFVKEVKQTYGGDADECYELVLNSAHENMMWREDADKIMIMIGDASPHGIHYRMNERRLDWENEAQVLAKNGIRVFAVHALSYYRNSSKKFYETVAKTTDGTYLTLDQFNEIIDLIKATLYQQGGEEKLNEFITIIKDNGKMTNSLNRNFRRLKGETVEDEYYTPSYSRRTSSTRKSKTVSTREAGAIKEMGELVPVLPGRFQVMTVPSDVAIKAFVEDNGIRFKTGRGFYELTKAVKVQQYKEIIIQDRETGEMFNGTQVREKLGLKPQTESGGVTESLHKDALKEFRVFIQSTSVNRKLIGGTTFLYEVDDIADTGTVVEVTKVAEEPTVVEEKPTVVEEKPTVVEEEPTVVEKPKKVRKSRKTKKVKDEEPTVIEEKPTVVEEETTKEEPVFTTIDTVEVVTAKKAKKLEEEAIVKKDKTTKKDKETKLVDKKAEKEIAKKKAKKDKATAKIKTAGTKLDDAFERYAKSENKKNTAYLVNNLKKMIESAEELIKLIEE